MSFRKNRFIWGKHMFAENLRGLNMWLSMGGFKRRLSEYQAKKKAARGDPYSGGGDGWQKGIGSLFF